MHTSWFQDTAPIPSRRFIAASVVRALCYLLLSTLMAACAALDPLAHAKALAEPQGLQWEQVSTGDFVLTTFSRISSDDRPLRVYIEGDGRAWIDRNTPSPDPTPRRAIGLMLAAADKAPNVVYLARPCQFTPATLNPRCDIPYWTGKRFAPEVVESLNRAIDHFAARVPGQHIQLVGYSGGSALAVLVAARRTDMASIRTVAGNLDSEFVNHLHRVSPMPQSENPIDFASHIAAIPQIHFSGAADEVVPPSVAQRFVEATGRKCSKAHSVPDMAHESDWGMLWPALLIARPECATSSVSTP